MLNSGLSLFNKVLLTYLLVGFKLQMHSDGLWIKPYEEILFVETVSEQNYEGPLFWEASFECDIEV